MMIIYLMCLATFFTIGVLALILVCLTVLSRIAETLRESAIIAHADYMREMDK